MSAKIQQTVRRTQRPSILPWLGAGGAVLLVVGGVFVWGLSGPPEGAERTGANDPAMLRLKEESLSIEQEFARIREVGIPTEADLQRLQRAIENQREWMRATGSMDPAQDQRLKDLESMYEATWARSMVAASVALETEARTILKEGQRAAGVVKLREALDRQRLVNQRRGPGGGRDLSRETELLQEISRLDAEPIAAELDAVAAEALRLRDAKQATEALAAYHRAHELQLRLNREFGRTQFASLANLEKLEVEIATLESAALLAEVLDLSAKAAAAQGRGDSREAASLFESAAATQQKLNTDFPRSRNTSTERLDTLEIARQTELSAEAAARVAQLDKEIIGKLRTRNLANVPEMLLEGARLQDAMFSRLPRSRHLDPELRLKFNFLLLQREAIEPVLRVLADKFRRVPGRETQIQASEMPQRLYELIMRMNPSRQSGADLPVESVNLIDVQEFCRRLGWMLGRSVRLPTEAEFRAAVGQPVTGLAFETQVWSQERSGQTIHQVASAAANAAGIYDLLGNVAEWLAPERIDAETTLVAGGSYTDPAATLATIPVEKRGRLDRARTIGFRVVVE